MSRIKTWKRYDNKVVPLTEKEITDIVNKKYYDCLPHTKEYIANGLRNEGPKFKARFCIMVKQDFIDTLYNLYPDMKFHSLDFSKLPEIIPNLNYEIELIDHTKIFGSEIGKFKVSREFLFNKHINPIGKFTKFINKPLVEDLDLKNKYITNIKSLENIYILNEIKFIDFDTTPTKIICKTCGKEYWLTIKDILKLKTCKNCETIKKKEINLKDVGEKWISRCREKHKNNCNYDNAVFHGTHEPITGLICKRCGKEFSQLPDPHYRSEYGYCPNCCKELAGAKSRSNIENVKQEAEKIFGKGVLDFSKSVYVTNQTPITVIEISTGIEFSITPNRLLETGPNLPIWHVNSTGEKLIELWLGSHKNIEYKSEVTHSEIEGRLGKNSGVRIDFEIYSIDNNKNNIWIEYNGIQHYSEKAFSGYFCSKYTFDQQIARDINVRKSSEERNITFIEIPYTYKTYEDIDKILTAILIEGKNPENVIVIPPIKYIDQDDNI